MAATRDDERRNHPRVPFDSTIDFQQDKPTPGSCVSKNISNRGLFVKTPRLLPPNTKLSLSIPLPGVIKQINVLGEVAWVSQQTVGNGPRGMGIRFVDLSQEDQQIISAFVDYLLREQRFAEDRETRWS